MAALLLAGMVLHAQEVPSGWKVVKDRQGACQIAVPPDWVSDKLVASFMQSPDGKANAVPHGQRAGQSLADAVNLSKMTLKVSKTIEESGTRVWFAFETNIGAGGTNWYVAVPGSPVCTAQVTFKSAATEETAKKIALSLTQAK